MRTKKVATIFYLDHSDDFSGGQISLLALLNLIDRQRFRPIVFIDHKAKRMAGELKKLGIEYKFIRYCNLRFLEYPLVFIPVLHLLWMMRSARCNVLHCNTFKAGVIGVIISLFTKVPVIFRARLGIIHRSHGFIDRIIYKGSNLILANSNYVKETFEQRFGRSNKIKVVYNPLLLNPTLNNATRERLKQKYFKTPSLFYFGALGRIEPGKRLHDIVEAVHLLSKRHCNFKVIFIGNKSFANSYSYYYRLKRLIKDRFISQFFEFTGFIPEIKEMSSLLNCVILSSEGEALSRGIYESQLLGIPVIASNSGGNPELVIHGETGLLYELGKPEDLADKMCRLIEDENLSNYISRHASIMVREVFANRNTIEKEQEEYEKLISKKM